VTSSSTPDKRALRETIRAQQRALTSRLKAEIYKARARARAELDASEPVQQERARRRRKRILRLLLVVLLLLLLWSRCACEEPLPPVVPPGPVAEGIASPPDPPLVAERKPKPPKKKRLVGVAPLSERPELAKGVSNVPAWLQEFRIQVAARSPRLAQCFRGTSKPGALRFTTYLDAPTGVIADPLLEGIGGEAPINAKQHQCILGVLAFPRYRFSTLSIQEERRALLDRVSLVIEF